MNKEQVKKLLLGALGLIALLYVYFSFFLGTAQQKPQCGSGKDQGFADQNLDVQNRDIQGDKTGGDRSLRDCSLRCAACA